MNFNSFEYVMFFIGVLATGWLLVGRPQLRIVFLLLASYYFYASNNGFLLVLILVSTLVDYIAGMRIEDSNDPRRRKLYMIASVVINLGILGYYKYFNFLAGSVAAGGQALGLDTVPPDFNIFLPVGISFYTFQSLSYTADVYMGRLKAERSLLRFSFFVAFFPQLVAGPIVRARYFLHQIPEKPRLTLRAMEGSLYLIFWGLFKKIVLADTLGDYVSAAFDSPEDIGAVTAWLGIYAFAFQIYFDFSGYTDIAIGCARLIGFRLPPNFRRPYASASFSEFWRRWHISLSYWLRDYLYKPLGGNRGKSKIFTYRNLMITMLLGGLWHGAAWTFVLWGGIHGLLLAGERALGLAHFARDYRHRPLFRFFKVFLIFNMAVLTWIPFRATSTENMLEFLSALGRFDHPTSITLGMLVAFLMICGGLMVQWLGEYFPPKRLFLRLPLMLKAFIYAGIITVVVVFSARGVEPFVYFRF